MKEPFHLNDNLLIIENWQTRNNQLIAGFTTRLNGVSQPPFDTLNLGLHVSDDRTTVIENREQVAKKLHFPLSTWVCAEQTHGTNISVIQEDDKGKGSTSYDTSMKDTDGLITNKQGILCTAFFADCVPLFFYDPKTAYIGIAHAGWKGTVNRIGEKMVNRLVTLGCKKEDILITIGPSVSKNNYEVNEVVMDHVDENLRNKVSTSIGKNRFLLDLKQLNVEILLQSGILHNNIDITSYCSYEAEDLLFSHRRDKGKTGRMLGYIGIKKQ